MQDSTYPRNGARQEGKPARNPVRELRPTNPLLVFAFRRFIARRRLRGAFRALRAAHLERMAAVDAAIPLIVYANHPSWWDPLTAFVLAPHVIGKRRFYAPMESASLRRYGVLSRLGIFPVEVDTPRGAAQFLRAAETVLSRGDVLGVTAQGSFTDIRVQPPALKPGVAALLARFERAGRRVAAVPLALEYTFWDQRLPEALACIGQPILVGERPVAGVVSHSPAATGPEQASAAADNSQTATERWSALLEERLAQTQKELAALAMTRDAGRFKTVLQGRRGTAGLYGNWQRLQRALHGESVGNQDHESHSGRKLPPSPRQ